MKSKPVHRTLSVLKSGFETDQPLVVGKQYHFVYTLGPGLAEVHTKGVLIEETHIYYYVNSDGHRLAIATDRVDEVNEIIGG